jgi:GT2 family glycosyltransferase
MKKYVTEIKNKIRKKYIEWKVKKQKENRNEYNKDVKVSAIVQSFNGKNKVKKIIKRLEKTKIDEIILIDDGSVDGTLNWAKKNMNMPNEFVVSSNDIYEVVMYRKMIKFASGNIVCLLQDDDLPPPNDEWIEDALSIFKKYKKLVILGGRLGLNIKIPDNSRHCSNSEYKVENGIAGKPGVSKYELIRDPKFEVDFCNSKIEFTQAVNRAPMFVRRKQFLNMGNIDLDFYPFQCDDVDVCIRAWKKGYKVALYESKFDRELGWGGMRKFDNSVSKQSEKNWKKIYQKHGKEIKNDVIDEYVKKSNKKICKK